MQKIILFSLLFFFNVLGLALYGQGNDWELIKEDAGIQIFIKETEGSTLNQIKVQNEMETTLSALIALMKDVENHHNWTYANKKTSILEKHSEFSWYFYAHSAAPWPVQDRDMIINATLNQDSITKIIRNEGRCMPDFIPKNKGIVRIPKCFSTWILEPLENGNVMVSLEIQIDLGGNIPNWLFNLVSTKAPYQTIKNMEKEVEKPPYKNAVLDYIVN